MSLVGTSGPRCARGGPGVPGVAGVVHGYQGGAGMGTGEGGAGWVPGCVPGCAAAPTRQGLALYLPPQPSLA